MQYGPWDDNNWENVDNNYWNIKSTLTRYSIAGDVGDKKTETEYLEDEIIGYTFSCFSEMVDRKHKEYDIDIIAGLPPLPDRIKGNLSNYEKQIAMEDDFPIICPVLGCQSRYRATGKVRCDNCGYKPLNLADQARFEQAQSRLDSKGQNMKACERQLIKSELLKELKATAGNLSGTIDNSLNHDNKSISILSKEQKQSRRTEQVAGCTIENTKISTQVLPSLDVNPNSAVTIRWVMMSFLIILGMVSVSTITSSQVSYPLQIGIVVGTGATIAAAGGMPIINTILNEERLSGVEDILLHSQIQWIWGVSDEGAADFDILETDPNFKRIRQIFGPGHAWACILRVVSDVLWNLGLEPLAIIYGYGSEKAQQCLRSGANLRKTRDFLKAIRKAFTNAFIREYIDKCKNVEEEPSFDGFNSYRLLISESSDVVLQSLEFSIFQISPAFDLIGKAMRNNHMASFWAGVLYLLPLLVLRNNYKYVALLLREIGIYQYYCPIAVLEEYKLIWCLMGQGLDFILEEVNRRIKHDVTRGSFQEYLVASIQHDSQLSYKWALAEALDITDIISAATGEYKERIIDQDSVAFEMENYLIDKRICRLDLSRQEMKTIDGSNKLLMQANMKKMHSQGIVEVSQYALAYKQYKILGTNKPKLNKKYAMTEEENVNPDCIRAVDVRFNDDIFGKNKLQEIVNVDVDENL
jgi:hypothetical protein